MESVSTARRRSARKAKGDGHLRRAEILQAAERIFVAEGFEGATIRRIAEEVGVSSTALYMHFPDKACILVEICQRVMQELLDRNSQIALRPLDAVNRTRMMLDAYMRWGFAHPNAYQLVFSAAHPLPQGTDATAELAAACYDKFCGVVREIAAEGRLRLGDGDSAAQSLWAACHGVVTLRLSRPNFPWRSEDELIQVTIEGLLSGLTVD
ncbi:MAG: TetR/AcrR family transcriptional regulator [Phenylobacterium sp.]|uniref:TetR/AcrR family transcriptional regulator n=1 Tax=Phenylobacterium sp. TaxID=1871053 RepID=UPI00271C5F05|nr:TetR/AcrR family transcriptional regulator [Phenylobacterium sp.]MDO8901722.1 TetR/AcrR family transcriptional regulator [Phenylobacterium sp.]MDP2213581.1 TetR/AcrR family transcriptional regulator [Phenylobacterium sp.]